MPGLTIPQFVIQVNGADIPPEMSADIARVEVDRAIFLPGMATLELYDPMLTWADDSRFAIGKPFKVIAAGFDDLNTRVPLFDGEITSIEVNIHSDAPSTLFIRAFDKSHRLQRGTKVRFLDQQTDSDAVSTVARESGLQATVTATTQVRDQIVQDNTTDYEFIAKLARRNGMVLLSDGAKVSMKKPSEFTAPAIPANYGQQLIEFHPVVSAVSQVNSVTARGWDPKRKQVVVGEASKAESGTGKIGWGSTGAAMSQSGFGAVSKLILTDLPFSKQPDGDAFAKAALMDRWRRDVHGEGRLIGEPNVVPGSWLQIGMIGTRFSGTYFVTRCRHVYRQKYYDTHFWISGLEPETTADLILGGAAQAGSGVERTGSGVAVGIVTNVNDPENMGRVKLKFPWLDDKLEAYWARMTTPMSGPAKGFQFMPEVNDEVLVAFEHGDRNQPYVIGSLWSKVDAPPMKSDKFFASGKVKLRQIVTTAGHVLEFDDTANSEKFSVTTPGKRTITFDDGGKTILVADKGSKNSIEIDSGGTGKITIKSSGDVTVDAGGKVTVNAKMDAAVNGMNVKVEAKGNLELSGAMVKVTAKAMLELSSTGIASLKGSLVKIN